MRMIRPQAWPHGVHGVHWCTRAHGGHGGRMSAWAHERMGTCAEQQWSSMKAALPTPGARRGREACLHSHTRECKILTYPLSVVKIRISGAHAATYNLQPINQSIEPVQPSLSLSLSLLSLSLSLSLSLHSSL